MALQGLERVGNLGYLGLAPETTIGTAVTPDDWTLLQDETMTTDYSLQDQTPIFGQPFETFQTLPGFRTHKGDVTVVAEPNTLTYFLDGLFSRGTAVTTYTITCTSANATVGATYTNNGFTFTVTATIASATTLIVTGPSAPSASGTLTKASGTGDSTITFSAFTTGSTTWPFTLAGPTATTVATKSYTMDISTGNFVKRFFGVMFDNMKPSWNKNEMQVKVGASALGSFIGAQLSATPTGSNPYTVTFETAYTSTPTAGLVVGDLIRFYHQGGSSYTDATIATIVNATQITTVTNVTGFVSGDYMYLRPATPSFNLLSTFLASNTTWQFGTNLTAAASAAVTKVELESTWELMNNFEKDSGSQRFGSPDPASLIRTTGNMSCTVKKFFDLTNDIQLYKLLTNTAIIITHYAGATNQYQFQIEIPQAVPDNPLPQLKAKSVNYETIKMHPNYSSSSSAGFLLSVTNAINPIA
jgi:hypothetical protein